MISIKSRSYSFGREAVSKVNRAGSKMHMFRGMLAAIERESEDEGAS